MRDIRNVRGSYDEMCIQGFVREEDHLQDLGVGGRIILKWNLDTRMGIRRMH